MNEGEWQAAAPALADRARRPRDGRDRHRAAAGAVRRANPPRPRDRRARGRRAPDRARIHHVARDQVADRRGRHPDRDRSDPPPVAALPALAAPVGRHRPPGSRPAGRRRRAPPADGRRDRRHGSPRLPRRARGRAAATPAPRAGRGRGDGRRSRAAAGAARRAAPDDRPDGSADRLDPDQRRRDLRRARRRCVDRDRCRLADRGRGAGQRRADLDPRDRHPRLAPFQPGIPADRRRQRRRPAGALGADRPERGDDQARPGPGGADGRAAALAAARLVPPRGRRGRATAVEGRGAGAARPPADGAAVGSRAVVEELLDRLVPDRPAIDSRPPRRARWKSPLRYRMLGWGGRRPASGRRAGVCAASPAGCRSRRRRASARCRARCSGGFASRPCTSTPPDGASAPRYATGTRPRRRPRLPSCRSSRARPGGAPALAPGWPG